MAIVFDVVQIVSPGAMTSTPAGRWAVGFFSKRDRDISETPEKEAEAFAAQCQEYTKVPGITYRVERHRELCPGRAKYPNETHETSQCRCR